jgi:diketogulonate reductase-like aldo/keto reductase
MTPMAAVPTITLNDGHPIPVVGLGVGELSEDEAERAVSTALESGYRLIDTAAAHGNEAAVGRAIAASGVPRSEIFVTSKVATQDQGFTTTKEAFQRSLDRLGLDYLDLYLIHWPAAKLGTYVDSYGALMVLQQNDLIRSIGVANFAEEYLRTIIELSYHTPAVNQIELHPLLNQAEMRAVHDKYGIVTEAYSPLAAGKLLDNPTVASIAEAHGKTMAQVLIRWSVQLGNVVISRSAIQERIVSNLDVFGFELTDADMESLNGLNDGTRVRPDPLTYTGT